MRGIVITFEGSEGCGKSTQIQLLAERLKELHAPVVTMREPGGTGIGEEIRHLLQYSKEGHAMAPEAELLLFAASRAQLVRERIEPELAAGTMVIADRFLDSTTVYQGVARRLDADKVRLVNEFAVGGCLPDITLVLDLDQPTARARMARRPTGAPDRMESQPPEFYEAVRAGYLQLARSEPERVRIIDAAPPLAEVQAEIWRILKEKFDGIFA